MSEENKNNGSKIYGILSYIGILWLIGLLADKESEFTKFHVNNGIWLSISAVVCGIIPCIGWLAEIAVLVFMIMGIVNAAKGEMKPLPLISKFPVIVK